MLTLPFLFSLTISLLALLTFCLEPFLPFHHILHHTISVGFAYSWSTFYDPYLLVWIYLQLIPKTVHLPLLPMSFLFFSISRTLGLSVFVYPSHLCKSPPTCRSHHVGVRFRGTPNERGSVTPSMSYYVIWGFPFFPKFSFPIHELRLHYHGYALSCAQRFPPPKRALLKNKKI